ncbi:MAG: radical SAM protein [Actinomycetota bacterium]|nr:radical SAM protein [Actinomycetota bacterium]
MKLFPSSYNYSKKINQEYTLINNTLTGALDVIENYNWELAEKKSFSRLKPAILSGLIDRGYFYPEPEKENRIFKELFKNYTKKLFSKPVRFVFCPSYSCNLACIYCFQKDLPYHPDKFMSGKVLDDSIRAAKKISEKNTGTIDSIELFGGEPLLLKSKGNVEKILKFADEEDSKIVIVTNGVLVKDFMDILIPVKKRIGMLQITVDGPPEIHDLRREFRSGRGSFDKIEEGIELLLENNINVHMRVNIDSTNIEHLPELYRYVSEKNWPAHPGFVIRPALVTDHSTLDYDDTRIPEEKMLEKLIKIYDKHPELENALGFHSFKPLRHLLELLSGAPNLSPVFYNCESNILEMDIFGPDGYIYACGESIGKPEYAIGRFSPGLEFFPGKEKLWTSRNIMSLDKCRKCKFAPICGGGCPYSSMLIYNNNSTPVCERFQEVLDTFIDLRGEKLLKKYME